MLRIVSEWIGLSKPTGDGWSQSRNQFFTDVEKRQTRRPEQVLESSGHVKIQVHGFYVDRTRSTVLIVIEHDECTRLVCQLRDSSDIGTESIFETHMGERHDRGFAVNHLFVVADRNRVSIRAHELNLCTSHALSKPYVPHGRKLELSHDHFFSLPEWKSAGNSVNACRNTGHNCDFIGIGMDECCESGSGLLISFHPQFPGRPMLMPARDVVLK